MSDLLDALEHVAKMHTRLRGTCPESSTPEGHFVNENTVVRLAAMMDWHKFKPKGKKLCVDATPAEKTVRVLFLFRHLVVHNGGRFDLSGPKRTDAERDSYDWFGAEHSAAKVSQGCMLCLSEPDVLVPLIEGCVEYWSERERANSSG